jgi:hypothetical protein
MAEAKGGKRPATKPANKATNKVAARAATKPVSRGASIPASREATAPLKKSESRPATKPVTRPATRPTDRPAKQGPKPKAKAEPKAVNASGKASEPRAVAYVDGPSRTTGANGDGSARRADSAWKTDGGSQAVSESLKALNGSGDSLLDQEDRPKARKPKLIRDSFTMPEDEYRLLGEIKKNCMRDGFEVKKSQLLRIGVALIREVSPAELKKKLAALVPVKTGRPTKEK